MNKALKIAISLTAIDQMSAVVNSAFSNLTSQYIKGGAMMGAGLGIGKGMIDFADDFKEFEEAATRTKIAIMGPGGIYNPETYKKITDYAVEAANTYLGSTQSYLEMVTVLKNNRINEEDILGGVGNASAQLAELFQIPAKESGLFAARIKNDMKVAVSDMPKMMDMLARMQGAGVGTTGEQTVYELTEFFSKAGLGAANLGLTGADEAGKLGALGGLFVTKGISGQTAGTNFRRIFDGLRDAERVGKTQAVGKQYGVDLEFFKDNKFAGIDNFVAQLSKLQNMEPQKISEIMKPFSGKQGLSIDFLEYLAKFGNSDFAEFNKRMAEQANLTEKVDVYLQSLTAHQLDAERSWKSARAALAESYNPALKQYYEYSSKAAEATFQFAKEHPNIIKWSAAILGGAAAILTLMGAFKVFMATMTFLGVISGFANMVYIVNLLKFTIMTELIPALAAMQLSFSASLGLVGALLSSMYMMNEFLEGDKAKNDYFYGVSAIPVKLGRMFSGGNETDTLGANLSKPVPVASNSSDSTYVFSPQIAFNGGVVNKSDLDTANAEAQRLFEKNMKQFEADKKRRSF